LQREADHFSDHRVIVGDEDAYATIYDLECAHG
jgi:hypothetical protein